MELEIIFTTLLDTSILCCIFMLHNKNFGFRLFKSKEVVKLNETEESIVDNNLGLLDEDNTIDSLDETRSNVQERLSQM